MTTDQFGSVLGVLVVVVSFPLTWYATIRLWLLSRREPHLRVLRERAIAMMALSLTVTVFAVVFVNNDQGVPPLTVEQTRVLTRGALFLLSIIPPIYWLWLYRRK